MRRLLLPLLGLLLLPAICPASLTGHMKVPEIDGESKTSGREGWIDLSGWDLGVEALTTDTTTRRQHRPLTVIKPIDKATPLLMKAVAGGTDVTGEIILEEGRELAAGGTAPWTTYKMRDARVSSIHLDGSPDPPIVRAVIEYTYAEWHVRELDAQGMVIDRASTYFDALSGEAGALGTAPRILQASHVEVASGETFTVDVTVLDDDDDGDGLETTVEADPKAVEIGPIRWMAPESLRISLTVKPTFSGQSTVSLTVSDGTDATTMSFSVYVDATGTPWGGFIDAYFSEEEQLDPAIAGPIADPDGDQLSTLMEFLFGTHPREHTPPEEQLVRTLRHVTPPGGGEPVPALGIEFLRRIDEPAISLSLYGSPDGKNWTRLESGSPLYEESSNASTNPLYESVNGNVTPPGGTTAYFLRFVGVM